MTMSTSAPQNLGFLDRLSVRLLLLFAGVFILTFLALFAYSISASYVERRVAEEGVVLQPQPVVVDPKLRDELSKVLASDEAPQTANVHDPFNDRTGLVGLSAAQRTAAGTTQTAAGTSSGGDQSNSVSASASARGGQTGGAGEVQVSSEEATKQRYSAWLGRAVTGDIPLDPRIFAIDDLLPVGVVDGGSGTQEVLFYSEAAGRTLSFPVGTMFNDGWLSELRPEGVVFSSGDERRTVRLRSWARSLRTTG